MSSDDIANLYRQFGGLADNYQELGRDNVVRQSRERWPLLANVRAQDAARAVQPVTTGERHVVDATGPVPTVFDEQATARAAAEARVIAQARAAAAVPPKAKPPMAMPAAARPAPEPVRVEPAPLIEPVLVETRPAVPAPLPSPAAPAAAPANGTELHSLFTRLARAPEPPATTPDPELSLLKRLLKP